MEIIKPHQWKRPQQESFARVHQQVRRMIEEIESSGDTAIEAFSRRFDGFEPQSIELKAWDEYELDPSQRKQLSVAADRIRRFSAFQMGMYRDMEMTDEFGRYGHRVVPLERMAAYVPAGRFPLVSTTLMTLIPAAVAGVESRLVLSPSDARPILAAASLAGATKFLRLGGAQAIAAAALGSGLHPAVDIIVGPGNAYVTAAKALLQDRVRIDSLAGPSELLILTDGSPPPAWLALDLMAQAEHDPMALSIVASTSKTCLQEVRDRVQTELNHLDRDAYGTVEFVHAETPKALIAFSDRVAPEHLMLACQADFISPDALSHFGSLFIGAPSTVAFGDYCTGPNHTLPTSANARRQGGLQVGDFLRILTYQELHQGDLKELSDTTCTLATMEGLTYHRKSVEIRQRIS